MTKNRIRLSCLVVALGCASNPNSEAFPTAFAVGGCGPADGPAIEFTLSATAQQEPIEPPLFRVAVYHSRAEAVGKTWPLAPASNTNGFAWYCARADDCEEATAGTLRLDPITDPTTQGGEVNLAFPKRGTVRGTFRAAWKELLILCG
jgi:hypothetical protein